MHFTVDRSQLLRVLSHAQGVVEKKTTVPILSHLRLSADTGSPTGYVSVAATDLDLAYSERLSAQVQAPGAASVPAHLLYDIVRKLPSKREITLTTEGYDANLKVMAGASEFIVPILSGDDFPDIQHVDMPTRFTMAASDVRFVIDHTRFAIAMEETRYYLNGLYWHRDAVSGHVQVVATDGHRLAKVRLAAPSGSEAMPSVILSRKTITEVRKMLDTLEGEVEVALSDRQVQFQFGEARLVSRVIDGVFPDYQRVIPHAHDRTARLKASELGAAVDRVAIITHERSRAVRFSFAGAQCVLAAHNTENGSAREEVAAELTGAPIDIGFNARYIADIVEHIKGEHLVIELSDPTAPALIRDTGDDRVLYVVMPMRV